MWELKHKYENLSDEELVEQLTTGPVDNRLHEYFFYKKCFNLLYFISSNIYKCENSNSIIGEFYEFISDNDWYVLRSWRRKNNSTLSNYLTTCAVNYFIRKTNKEKKRNSIEFIPSDPEFINAMDHLIADEAAEQLPVWEAFNKLDERNQTILQLLVIEGKSVMIAAPAIWKYIKSEKSYEEASEKKIQSTIAMAKSRAILSLTKELKKILN